MEIEFEKQKAKIKKLLADYLGVEPEDINDEDGLTEQLHMAPTDITDFNNILEENGFDITKLDFEEIETFQELCEGLIGI